MSIYALGEVVVEPFPGVEVIQAEPGYRPEEFRAFVSSLVAPFHLDMSGKAVAAKSATIVDGGVTEMSRTPNSPRDPWAPDHHWHSDRTYWGENPFATVLYAGRLLGKVASTGIIDTSLLVAAIRHDQPSMVDDMLQAQVLHSVDRYYREILPVEGSAEAIARTLFNKKVATLEEVADKESLRYPPKAFPAMPTHPFRGTPCTMVDEVRAIAVIGLPTKRSIEIIEHIRKNYLALPHEELEGRPYYYSHPWEEGQAIIYPQVGTFHRAESSPPGEDRRDTMRLFIV